MISYYLNGIRQGL